MHIKIPDRITKRGVIHIGWACDARCKFCYYRDSTDKNYMLLGTQKEIIKNFKKQYDLKQIDITGGEPTIFPKIQELVDYCNQYEIKPTIITHGLYLDKIQNCEYLISIHGVGKEADMITETDGFFEKQNKQIEKYDKSFRTNTTVYLGNYKSLSEIADYIIEIGSTTHNFIMYNPFISQSNVEQIFVKFTGIEAYLTEAIDKLEEAKIKTNVRYIPFCMLKKHQDNIVGWKQLQFDMDEWNFLAWHQNPKEIYFDAHTWYKYRENALAGLLNKGLQYKRKYEDFGEIPFIEWGQQKSINAYNIRAQSEYFKDETCKDCSLDEICDGFSSNYIKHFGSEEIEQQITNGYVVDVNYFKKAM